MGRNNRPTKNFIIDAILVSAVLLILAGLFGLIVIYGRNDSLDDEIIETESEVVEETETNSNLLSIEDVFLSNADFTDPYEAWVTAADGEVNIRKSSSANSDIVGYLNNGDYAIVTVPEENGWIGIQSGDISGYVSSDYVITGTSAYNDISKSEKTMVIIDTDGVRVRSDSDQSSSIITMLNTGSEYEVLSISDNWVKILCSEGEEGWISLEYASLKETYPIAESAEDRDEAIELEENIRALASLIFCEAGGEPFDAKVGVGAVVMNRVASPIWNDTIYGVITEAGQFEPVSLGQWQQVYYSYSYTDSCVDAAIEAMNGNDPTGGCTYFVTTDLTTNGLVIGRTCFFTSWADSMYY